jgi:hypothetical protein
MKLVIYSFFSKKERHLDRPINSLILLDQVNIIKMKYKKGNSLLLPNPVKIIKTKYFNIKKMFNSLILLDQV